MDLLEPLLQCRACSELGAEYELVALFGGGHLARIYSLCTGLVCVADDGLPNHLCAGCNAKLVGFNKFRQRCVQWDAEFRAHLPPPPPPASPPPPPPLPESPPPVVEEKKEVADIEIVFTVQEDTIEPIAEQDVEEEAQHMFDSEFHIEVLRDQYDMDSQEMLSVKSMPDDEYTDDCNPPVMDSTDVVVIDDERSAPEEPANQSHSHSGDHPQTDFLTAVVYQCDICAARFFKKARLENHMHDQHSMAEQRTVCGIAGCTKSYASKQAMRMHRRKMHSPPDEAEPLVSPSGHNVPAEEALNPSDAPEARSFVCEQCGKCFKSNGALKKHGFSHSGQMPYACTYCPRRYVTRHKLKEHTMRHEGVRNHVCPHCGMRKTTAHELKVHINYHTREKVWQCESCPKRFTNMGNLSRHVRIVHNGIREYTCTFCQRSFGKAETLKHHVMTHTGERPHGCDVCGKRFIQLVALQTHQRTHLKRPKGGDKPDVKTRSTEAEPERRTVEIIMLKVEKPEADTFAVS